MMLFLDIECKNLQPFIHLVRGGIIPLIQIGIPIILIILGMLDLGKAVMASKEDEIKSAQKLLVKRIIYAVAIFFVVFIVTLIFDLISSDTDGATTWKDCWKCNVVDTNGKCCEKLGTNNLCP